MVVCMRMFEVSLRRAAAAAVLFLPHEGFAQSFIIDNGQAVFGNLVLAGPGDIGTIVSGGSVNSNVDGLDAIVMEASDQSLEIQQHGLLLQDGNLAAAILSIGANAEIENFGIIATTGDAAHAIVSLGDNATIDNYGAITTEGAAAAGFVIAGTNGHGRNMGTLRATGDAAMGVILDGTGSSLENRGTIETTGLASSGLIVGDHGDGSTVINHGSIISPLDGSSAAINVSPDADGVTLALGPGSVIQGAINFAGTNGTVRVANGMNTALQFNLPNPAGLQTFGSPYAATADNLLAIVDPTGFAAQADMLSDVTGAITGALDQRFAQKRAGDDEAVWLSPLAGYRHAKADSPAVGFDNLFSGLVIGVDRPARNATSAGFFAGGTFGEMETDTGSQTLDMQTYLAGSYASFMEGGAFWDFGVMGAVANFDSDRRIANNLVAGGIAHASASYTGLLLSPSLNVGTDIPAGWAVLTPSVRLRYAALFVDEYDELGSAVNLDVARRRVDALEMRWQFAASMMPCELPHGILTQVVRLGAEASYVESQSVDAMLLGQTLNFEAGGPEMGARGFVGLETRYVAEAGWQASSLAEFGYDTTGSLTVSASMVLDIPF
jgi:outer membrane autotransporter protein